MKGGVKNPALHFFSARFRSTDGTNPSIILFLVTNSAKTVRFRDNFPPFDL